MGSNRQVNLFGGETPRATYTCDTCGQHCPESGAWGPPLMSPASRWYCQKHGRIAWDDYLRTRKE